MTGPAPADLQPRELTHAAYAALWHGRNELLRVAAVPVVLTLLLDVALFFGLDATQSGEAALPVWFYVLVLLSIPLSALFAVNWLRVLVLGSAAVPGLGLHWGGREMQFLLRILVIGLAGLAATFIVSLPVALAVGLLGEVFAPLQHLAAGLPLLSIFLVLFIYAYLTLGFSLALVAAAIEAPGGLRDSWKATRGSRGRLVLAVIPVVGPFYLLLFLLPYLIAELGLDDVAPLSSLLVQVVLATITSAAGLAFISVVYRRIAATPPARLPRE